MYIKLKNGRRVSVSKNSARAVESYFKRKGLLTDAAAAAAVSPRKHTEPSSSEADEADTASKKPANKKPASKKPASKKTASAG